MNNFVDFHCDLPSKIYLNHANLHTKSCHWNANRVPCSAMVQVFTNFVDQTKVQHPFDYVDNMIDAFMRALAASPNVFLTYSYHEICCNLYDEIHSAVLAIEGGEALEGDLENLSYFHSRGVQLLTLTWNYENELGYGCMVQGKETAPLKPFGIEVVHEMNQLNMMIDVSHLNQGGFWSVAENSEKPFMASHSNARAVCDHVRNLDDEQIRCIVQKGGIIGLNLYPDFLSASQATETDILRHIDHFLSLGAEECLSLGCDFDGIDKTLPNYDSIASMRRLEKLCKTHYSKEVVAKIFYINGMKWLHQHLL